MKSVGKDHGGIEVDHSRQLTRLRRIEGQVRGLQQMIEDRRYCIEVAQQINATIAALRRVEADMIRDHLKALIEASTTGGLPDADRERLAEEIASLLAKS